MPNKETPHERPGWTFAQYALVIVATSVVIIAGVLRFVVFAAKSPSTSPMRTENPPDSVASLRAQLRTNPESAAIRLQLATLLRDSQPEEALRILGEIRKTDPQWVAATQQAAVIHLLTGHTDAAKQSLHDVVVADPENIGAQLALAELYFDLHDARAALPYAQAAARLAPDRPQTLLLIAEIYDELHDHAAMVEPLENAIALDPDLYEARLNLAYACKRTGQLAKSKTQAEWCLNRNPREVAALRILASIARDEGRIADAEDLLSRARKVRPNDVDCRILEADILLYQRKPRDAYERLKEIYDANRNTVRYLGALARAAASAGERDEARKHYQVVDELVNRSRDQSRTTNAP